MPTTYIITGRPARRGGQCIACHQWCDPARPWESILVQEEGEKAGWAVGHAECLGGKVGGANRTWKGPATVQIGAQGVVKERSAPKSATTPAAASKMLGQLGAVTVREAASTLAGEGFDGAAIDDAVTVAAKSLVRFGLITADEIAAARDDLAAGATPATRERSALVQEHRGHLGWLFRGGTGRIGRALVEPTVDRLVATGLVERQGEDYTLSDLGRSIIQP